MSPPLILTDFLHQPLSRSLSHHLQLPHIIFLPMRLSLPSLSPLPSLQLSYAHIAITLITPAPNNTHIII